MAAINLKCIKKEHGFTLTELLIVIAVVSILLAIAAPSYRSYIERASRSDAHIAIQKLVSAQERIYAIQNQYTDTMSSLGGSSSPEGLYTISAVTGIWSGADCSTATSDTAATNAYTILAVPVVGKSQANDSQCTCIYMNSRGVKGSTGSRSNADDCW